MRGTEINELRAEIRVLIVSNFIVILVNLICFSVFVTLYLTDNRRDTQAPLIEEPVKRGPLTTGD